jgi:hypothetical protein
MRNYDLWKDEPNPVFLKSLVFTYPNGGPVILLPAYKSGEAVKPIHQVMVNRRLMDAGILEARALPMIGYAKTASKFRPAHKTKSPAKHGAPPKRGRKLNGLA